MHTCVNYEFIYKLTPQIVKFPGMGHWKWSEKASGNHVHYQKCATGCWGEVSKKPPAERLTSVTQWRWKIEKKTHWKWNVNK